MTTAVTYADLVTPMTKDQIMEEVALPIFAAYDFPVDAWGPTDEPIADIEVQCETLAGMSVTIAETAKGATLDASGDWLLLKAQQNHGIDKRPPKATVGTVKLVDATGSPQSFTDGQLLVVDKTTGDILFKLGPSSVPANGEATVTITAEVVGTKHNLVGAELQLATPIAGLTMVVADRRDWITSAGTDLESDESLRQRCRLAQAALSPDDDIENHTGLDDQYERWAREASSEVNRVHIQEDPIAVPPAKPVTIIVAGVGGALSPAAFTAVSNAIQRRRPLGIEVGVQNAGTWTCVVRGTVKIKTAFVAAAMAKVIDQLEKYFRGESIKIRDSDELPLAGLGLGRVVLVEQLVEIIMAVDGVEGVVLEDGSGNPLPLGTFIGGIPAGDTVALLDRVLLIPQAV